MIQAGDDSQVFDLLVAELPVGSIHLRENVAGVDEQDLVLFVRLGLVLVKEPERGRQGNRGEHIGGQRHHLADDALFDHLFADLVLALACVGGRVCHDQRRLAVLIQGRGKVADPQVVGVGNRFFLVGGFFRRLGGVAGNAVGIEARITADTVKGDLVHVERRICHDVIEGAESVVGIGVEGVGLGDVAAHVVEQQVHFSQLHGVRFLLYTVAAELHLLRLVCIVGVHVPRSLDKHAAGTASGIEKFFIAGLRVQHFDHIPHDCGRRIEGPAVLTLCQGEVAEEVFIDLAEDINGAVFGDILENADDVGEQLRLLLRHELGVDLLGQHTLHLGIFPLDGLHGLFHQIGLLRCVRRVINKVIIGALWEEEAALFDRDLLAGFLHAGAEPLGILRVDLILVLLEQNIRIAKEDQAEDRLTVFVRRQMRTGTQHVRRMPEVVL